MVRPSAWARSRRRASNLGSIVIVIGPTTDFTPLRHAAVENSILDLLHQPFDMPDVLREGIISEQLFVDGLALIPGILSQLLGDVIDAFRDGVEAALHRIPTPAIVQPLESAAGAFYQRYRW